jgi:type VI protein secretion system component Hcp
MDQTKTDLVMKFTLTPENDVPAEGVVDIDPHDDLMWDFHGATYDDYSNFFEITDFSMKMQLKPDDDHKSKTTSSHGHTSTPHAQHIAQQVKNGSADEWSRWRSATTANEMRTIKYPFYVENLTFDRTIDSASPIFFQYCCKQQKFHSAVLCKRLAQGNLGASIPKAYLRIEFTDVTITDISWDDGDLVKETCEFKAQGGMKLTYLKQKSNAALEGASDAEWLGNDKDRMLDVRRGGRRS